MAVIEIVVVFISIKCWKHCCLEGIPVRVLLKLAEAKANARISIKREWGKSSGQLQTGALIIPFAYISTHDECFLLPKHLTLTALPQTNLHFFNHFFSGYLIFSPFAIAISNGRRRQVVQFLQKKKVLGTFYIQTLF